LLISLVALYFNYFSGFPVHSVLVNSFMLVSHKRS